MVRQHEHPFGRQLTPFGSPAVAVRFDTYPPQVRRNTLALRELILITAAQTPGVGEIDESLKWREPAYSEKHKAGSTIRMDWKSKEPEHWAMYCSCHTNLVDTFRVHYPRALKFEGSRAIVLSLEEPVPRDALA